MKSRTQVSEFSRVPVRPIILADAVGDLTPSSAAMSWRRISLRAPWSTILGIALALVTVAPTFADGPQIFPVFSDVTIEASKWEEDLDGDEILGSGDLAVLIGDWGSTDSPADIDGDGVVTSSDLAILLGRWGDSAALAVTIDSRGCSWADYDSDGDPDLFLHTWMGVNYLFRNNGDGTFDDVTNGPEGQFTNGGRAVFGDLDNDGDLDLFLSKFSPNILLRNDGLSVEGFPVFTDITTPELADAGNGTAAALADYDNDGDLDLYVVNRIQANILYRNDNGVFVDATPPVVAHEVQSRGAQWVDYDDDGDMDLYLVCGGASDAPSKLPERRNHLYRNEGFAVAGVQVFTDVTVFPLDDGGDGRGCHWTDFDLDGDLDVYVANLNNPMLPIGVTDWPSVLLRNDGVDGMGLPVFTLFDQAPIAHNAINRDGIWMDWDNDGDQDLYLASADCNTMLRNDGCDPGGDPVFVDATTLIIGDCGITSSAAVADYDGDGDLDVYLGQKEGSINNKLLRNDYAGSNAWIQIDLVGTVSNRTSIGARVYVTANGKTQMREHAPGSRYMCQDWLTIHFGLGTATMIDELRVVWPSGQEVTMMGVSPNQRMQIIEPTP